MWSNMANRGIVSLNCDDLFARSESCPFSLSSCPLPENFTSSLLISNSNRPTVYLLLIRNCSPPLLRWGSTNLPSKLIRLQDCRWLKLLPRTVLLILADLCESSVLVLLVIHLITRFSFTSGFRLAINAAMMM